MDGDNSQVITSKILLFFIDILLTGMLLEIPIICYFGPLEATFHKMLIKTVRADFYII